MTLLAFARCAGVLASLTITARPSSATDDQPFRFHHDHVLGTSLDLEIHAALLAAAHGAEQAVLAEIDRVEKQLSTYDRDSELSRWQSTAPSTITPVSDELFEVFARCDAWRTQSDGAFNATAEVVWRLWQKAEKSGQLPSEAEQRHAADLAREPVWQLDEARHTAEHLSQTPITLDGLAKGYIIDCASDVAMRVDGVSGIIVNIGGDLRARGEQHHQVAIINPFANADNAEPVARIDVTERAVATSGNYRRGLSIAGRWYSHIVDPRCGAPVDHVVSATVITAKSADAGALATTFSVLPVEQSLALAARLPEVECLLVTKDRRAFASPGWRKHQVGTLLLGDLADDPKAPAVGGAKPESAKADAPAAKAPFAIADAELVINLEIARQDAAGRGYRRPYLSVWIEDQDGYPVRTLALWFQNKGEGLRWLRELRRWYHDDEARRLVDERNFAATLSSATRPPGKYKLVWDGKDDSGKLVEKGKYTLLIEASREHGTYQIIREEIELPRGELSKELNGNVEIKGASIEYRRRTASAQ